MDNMVDYGRGGQLYIDSIFVWILHGVQLQSH